MTRNNKANTRPAIGLLSISTRVSNIQLFLFNKYVFKIIQRPNGDDNRRRPCATSTTELFVNDDAIFRPVHYFVSTFLRRLMMRKKLKLPEPLILTGREDLPVFTGEFLVDVCSDETHVNALKEGMPLTWGEEAKPTSIVPDETNLTG